MNPHVGLDFLPRSLFANQFCSMACEVDEDLRTITSNGVRMSLRTMAHEKYFRDSGKREQKEGGLRVHEGWGGTWTKEDVPLRNDQPRLRL